MAQTGFEPGTFQLLSLYASSKPRILIEQYYQAILTFLSHETDLIGYQRLSFTRTTF